MESAQRPYRRMTSAFLVGLAMVSSSCELAIRIPAAENSLKTSPTPSATPTPTPIPLSATHQLRNTRLGLEYRVEQNYPGSSYYAIYNSDPGTLTAAQVKSAATGATGGSLVANGTVTISAPNTPVNTAINSLADKAQYWLLAVSESTDGLDSNTNVKKFDRILPKSMTQINFNKVTAPSIGTLVRYAAAVPQDYYNNPSTDYPLLIWIPGNGESFTDVLNSESNFTSLAGFMGPFKRLNNDLYDIPMIVIAVQCNYSYFNCWNQAETSLFKDAYDDVVTKLRVNTKRVYVSGISFGGQGALLFANAFPSVVSAVAPIASDSTVAAGTLCTSLGGANIPVWALINQGDSVFGAGPITGTINSLRSCVSYTDTRARARLTVFAPISYPNTLNSHGSAENISLRLPFYSGGAWRYFDGVSSVLDTNPPTNPAAFASELISASPGTSPDAPFIVMDSFPTLTTDLSAPINSVYDWMLQFSKP